MAGSITVEEFAPMSQRGGFDLIDVRTPMEFYEVHAVGALLAPLDTLNPKLIMESRGARATEPLYIICRSGADRLRHVSCLRRRDIPTSSTWKAELWHGSAPGFP